MLKHRKILTNSSCSEISSLTSGRLERFVRTNVASHFDFSFTRDQVKMLYLLISKIGFLLVAMGIFDDE